MIAVLALAVAVLVAVGVELLLCRSLFRAILGLSLLAHAANLIVIAAGGAGAAAPVLGGSGDGAGGIADPLPQAFVLTAIVISMAVTLYLIGVLRATARDLGSVTIGPALGSDEGRDPEAVTGELRPPGGAG